MKIMPVSNVPGQFIFWCPGCQEHHGVWTDPEHPNKITGSKWTFDGNMERPTFSPSILTTGRKMTDRGQAEYDACWSTGEYVSPGPGTEFEARDTRCHLHIVNGQIHYCDDCDHALAGKAVPMEDIRT